MVDLNIDLPESFLEDEERDGYLVKSSIKRLWAVELDLLNEFNRVCKKHGIKYILDFGSLLGAIRHKGFIPWDDDVDVSMLRDDYEKLMAVGPQEFKYPYFLQTKLTERGYNIVADKLRRSDTAFLEDNIIYRMKFNQGIFIDIFVFDNLPNEGFDKQLVRASKTSIWRMYTLGNHPTWSVATHEPRRVLRYIKYRLKYGSIIKVYKQLEQLAKTQSAPREYVGSIMGGCTRCRPRRWFEDTVDVPFENLCLPVSTECDALLKSIYGDYMTPVRDAADHKLLYYDTCRSYKEVLRDKKLMRKLRRQILKP